MGGIGGLGRVGRTWDGDVGERVGMEVEVKGG